MNVFMKVFLGGTCNNSIWRDVLIPLLTDNGINYFNPVVDEGKYLKNLEDIPKYLKEFNV